MLKLEVDACHREASRSVLDTPAPCRSAAASALFAPATSSRSHRQPASRKPPPAAGRSLHTLGSAGKPWPQTVPSNSASPTSAAAVPAGSNSNRGALTPAVPVHDASPEELDWEVYWHTSARSSSTQQRAARKAIEIMRASAMYPTCSRASSQEGCVQIVFAGRTSSTSFDAHAVSRSQDEWGTQHRLARIFHSSGSVIQARKSSVEGFTAPAPMKVAGKRPSVDDRSPSPTPRDRRESLLRGAEPVVHGAASATNSELSTSTATKVLISEPTLQGEQQTPYPVPAEDKQTQPALVRSSSGKRANPMFRCFGV